MRDMVTTISLIFLQKLVELKYIFSSFWNCINTFLFVINVFQILNFSISKNIYKIKGCQCRTIQFILNIYNLYTVIKHIKQLTIIEWNL